MISLAICSCSKRADTENVTRTEPVRLSAGDNKAILGAITAYDKTTNVQIVLSEDWGKTDGKTEYKITIDNPQDSQKPLAYWLIKENGAWKVTSREL